MTTLTDALARAPNPLAASTASDSDGSTGLVDVPSLHAQARQALVQGCERVRRGRSQVFALVGEPGLGKSHLLLWLRQRLTLRGDALTYYISMPALPDLAQPFRHALRQLVGALCRRELAAASDPTDASGLLDRPIDRLLWGALYTQACDLLDAARVGMYQGQATLLKLLGPMCNDAGRKRPLADFAAAAQKVWPQVEPGLRSYLLSLPTEMSIDSAARAVLLQFPYADRRALCTAWLAGEELSQKDRERIAAKQVINNENAAKYVLCSVVRLLTAPPGALLVLTYDQTQQLGEQLGQPGIQAMAEVVAAIHGCGGSALQVLSLQPTSFSQLYDKPTRPAAAQGPARHLDQTVRLSPASPEQLRELVAARLSAGLADATDRPSPLYPLTDAELALTRWPKEADSPRAALQVFAQRYAERRRELVPGSDGSGGNAVSSPAGRRPSTPASKAKDAPSIPGTGPVRRAKSSQSPSLDFLSDEETSDAVAVAPAAPAADAKVRPRSLTHPDESGATGTAAKPGSSRAGQPFVADSSPTLQAVPKDALAGAIVPTSAKARELAREAKVAPSFTADSSPTQRALTDDVMGRVHGPGGASKRPPEAGRELKPSPATAAPSRGASLSSEDVVMGRLGRPAKAADAPSIPDKLPEKPADKSAARAATSVPLKAADAGLTKKTASAVPHVEADSSPTLKRGPDESLLKASRDISRPDTSSPLRSPAPSGDSATVGRATSPLSAPSRAAAPSGDSATVGRTTSPLSAPSRAAAPSGDSATVGRTTSPLSAPSRAAAPSSDSATLAPTTSTLSTPSRATAPSSDSAALGRPTPTLTTASRATAPSSDSGVIGRSTPTMATSPALISASQPSRAPAKPAVTAKPVALAPPAKPPAPESAPSEVSNVPDPLPPSAESPSMGWLAMANDEDRLTNALKKTEAKEAAASAAKAPAGLSEPPRPTPATAPPTRPQSPSTPPKSGAAAGATPAATARAAAAPPATGARASAPPAAARPAVSTPPAAAQAAPSAPPASAKARASIPPTQTATSASTLPPASSKANRIPAVAPAPVDNVPDPLPPSAESPSMGWLAMASGSSQLDEAIAQSGLASPASAAQPSAPAAPAAPMESAPSKSDKSESGPNKARAARPVRGTVGMGVVVVNPSTVKPAEPSEPAPAEPVAARAPARSTLARMPAVQLRTAQSVSPQQVLAALPERGMMEDWQLAQELGVPLDALEKILVGLEDDGHVRLMAMGDGQRMVVRID